MKKFYHKLGKALAEGPVALATVIAAEGSTPRLAGARQALTASGELFGTVGGGVMEARVLELAREVLLDGKPRIFRADLHGKPGDVRDGICGGTMSVGIIQLTKERDQAIINSLNQSLKAGEQIALTTRIQEASPLILEDSASKQNDAMTFSEIVEPPPCLLIFGGGHIGRSLAHLTENLGFSTLVQDDRLEWLIPDAFPKTCTLESTPKAAIKRLHDWMGKRYVALVTRSFTQDLEALEGLNAISHLDYIGMLGSKLRVATVLAKLKESGTAASWNKIIRAPIGIQIGAQTPEEIAVSIAAELIQVRQSYKL